MSKSEPRLPGKYARMLAVTHNLRAPVIQAIIQALALPPGGLGLDAGCGIGLLSVMLADALGPDGGVAGVDLSPDFVRYAREMAAARGLSDQLSFREGDVNALPFESNTFDWAWSTDCIGYAPFDPYPPLKELIRVVVPGGKIAIMAWSSEQLLPGYPRLEARLGATTAGISPFVAGSPPSTHFLNTLGRYRELGLVDLDAQTFAGTVHAPLDGDTRDALEALFEMRWPGVETELSPDDQETYRRVCTPGSPDFILDHPDYLAFYTYTLFTGVVPWLQ